MTGVLLEEANSNTHTQMRGRKKLCGAGGRGRSDVSTNQGTPNIAEAKREALNRFSLRVSKKEPFLLTDTSIIMSGTNKEYSFFASSHLVYLVLCYGSCQKRIYR